MRGNVSVKLPNGTVVVLAIVNGTVNISFTLAEAGNYSLSLEFNGTDYYYSASGIANVTVIAVPEPVPSNETNTTNNTNKTDKPDSINGSNLSPIDTQDNLGINSKLNSSKNSGLAMKRTGLPLLALFFALFIIPFTRKRK